MPTFFIKAENIMLVTSTPSRKPLYAVFPRLSDV